MKGEGDQDKLLVYLNCIRTNLHLVDIYCMERKSNLQKPHLPQVVQNMQDAWSACNMNTGAILPFSVIKDNRSQHLQYVKILKQFGYELDESTVSELHISQIWNSSSDSVNSDSDSAAFTEQTLVIYIMKATWVSALLIHHYVWSN